MSETDIVEIKTSAEGPKRAQLGAALRGLCHGLDVELEVEEHDMGRTFFVKQSQWLITLRGEKELVRGVLRSLQEGIEEYNG
jgi:hypothetical protein